MEPDNDLDSPAFIVMSTDDRLGPALFIPPLPFLRPVEPVGNNLHTGVGKQPLFHGGRLHIAKAPKDLRGGQVRFWSVFPPGLDRMEATEKKERGPKKKGREKVASFH